MTAKQAGHGRISPRGATLPRGPASGKSRRHSLKDSRPWKASNPGLTWVTGKKTPAIPEFGFKAKRTRHGKEHDLRLVRQGRRGAARFYAATFPDSAVGAVHRAPSDYPSGKKGDVLTVEFTVAGIPCLGLNGGPMFKHSEAFSFQIATDDQQETDRYWNAIVGNGGQESMCGWCKDRWGISWQITPRVLTEAMAAGGDEAKRAFDAMMSMKKIDVAAIQAARRG